MNRRTMTRAIAVLAGATVLFGLEQGLDLKFYMAFPAALLAYFAALVGVGLMLGADNQA
jgi:hypothetical protein